MKTEPICPNCKCHEFDIIWVNRCKDNEIKSITPIEYTKELIDRQIEKETNTLNTLNYGNSTFTFSYNLPSKSRKEILEQYTQFVLMCKVCKYTTVTDIDKVLVADEI